MAPSEAERLNIEMARFYLSDAKTVRAYCHRVYARSREQAGREVKSRTQVAADLREHMRRLREHYAGKGSA